MLLEFHDVLVESISPFASLDFQNHRFMWDLDLVLHPVVNYPPVNLLHNPFSSFQQVPLNVTRVARGSA